MTVKTADITFPEKGLVLVIGSNLASEGKLQSVGSGKTSLGEALARAITGTAGRYSNLSYFAPELGKGGTLVTVEAQLLGKPLTIEMGYKAPELSKTGEGLRFTYDGKVIQRGHIQQTRQELGRAVQVTPELADWTVLMDGERLRFNQLSQEDSVNLLMTALAQPPWTSYYERATKVLQNGKRQVAVATQALEMAKLRLQRLKDDLDRAHENHDDAKANYERQVEGIKQRVFNLKKENVNERNSIAAAEKAIEKAQRQLKLLEEQNAARAHRLEIDRQALRDALAQEEAVWAQTMEAKSARGSEYATASKNLEEMRRVPKNCPKCGKPWDTAHSEEELAKADAAVKTASEAYAAAMSTHGTQERKRNAIQQKIMALDDQLRTDAHLGDAKALGTQITQNDRLIRNLNATITQRERTIVGLEKGVDNSSVVAALAVIQERQAALTEGETAIRLAAQDLAAEEQAFRVIEYWHKAFGPTGIPNMVLASAIEPLNRVAQRISNLMTGGTLHVSYSTRRELVSGESKAQLVIKVVNSIGSKRMEGNSKGEAGLTNLIITENISEIGGVSNRIGFRWYDEITTGQDPVVRRSIFSYLKDVAQKLGILIFVVDHHAEAANYADHVLVAEKSKAQGTRFFWK